MAAIRSHDTAPELYVRRTVHSHGFRFRLRPVGLPGKPDLVFPRFRVAVFVNGCFWHGHDCSAGHTPRTNRPYWIAKIQRNQERDSKNLSALAQLGWQVYTIWECCLQDGVQEVLLKLKNLCGAYPSARRIRIS